MANRDTAMNLVRTELAKSYGRYDDISITSMQLYSNGIVVLFTRSWSKEKPEHRVAYFEHWSIESELDTLHMKFDFIA